jgi:mevalonate kinase
MISGMSVKIRVPGKVFISGEYAALKGLPALTVATKPEFEFTPDDQALAAFHPDSPAGLVNPFLRGRFHDPFKGVGGMGRSTAEFIAAAVQSAKVGSNWDMWRAYREVVLQVQNTPSGVDLLTQLAGGYCVTSTRAQSLEKAKWPFQYLDWVALVTGNKVKTHEHLSRKLELDWDLVGKLNQNITSCFLSAENSGDEQKIGKEFAAALGEWRKFLFENQLEVPATTELVELFLDVPGVVAAKGCGALGSDVVFVLFEKNISQFLEKTLEYWNPAHIIRSSQVQYEGLKVINEIENVSAL